MPRRLVPVVLLTLSLAACGAAPVRDGRPEAAAPARWPFADTILPAPPAQQRPWSPPAAGLPAPLIRAVDTLFRLGLADPRGLPYRQAEIVVTTHPESPPAPLATRVWVLPGDTGGPHFGVAWNGLVYPLGSVGAPADLRADVAALLRADAGERDAWARDHPDFPFLRSRHPRGELHALRLEGLQPLQVALLLRLGDHGLARQLWTAWCTDAPSDPPDPELLGARDALVVLARHWIEPLHHRAVWAHARGDDGLALASLRGLSRIGPALRQEALRLGAPPHDASALDPGGGALLADQERRARAARTPRPESPAPAGPAARVAAAIEALDQIRTPLWGRARDAQLAREPLVQSLIREADAAIGPLLDALEKDERLTRAVWLGRHDSGVVAVSEIVAFALSVLLADVPPARAQGAADARTEAARLRAAWMQWRDVPREERWARVLADDGAGAAGWIEAAQRVALLEGEAWTPGVPGILEALVKEGGPPPPRLPALRDRRSPSIAALMARRIDALAAAPREACHLAALLGLWDPAEGAQALAAQARRALALAVAQPDAVFVHTPCIAALTVARAQGGDAAALEEYAAWIRGASPDRLGGLLRIAFAPMGFRPRHPAIEAAARALFEPEGSPWVARLRTGALGDVLAGPAVRAPAFQDRVLRTLGDRSRVGWIEIEASGDLYAITIDGIDVLHAGMTGGTIEPSEAGVLPPRSRTPLRACDVVAAQLAAQPGAPPFRVVWTEPRRDQAIDALRAFAQALGAR